MKIDQLLKQLRDSAQKKIKQKGFSINVVAVQVGGSINTVTAFLNGKDVEIGTVRKFEDWV